MDQFDKIKVVMDEILPKFEEVYSGIADIEQLQTKWKASRVSDYDLHPQLASFYLIAGGMVRVRGAYDDALSIYKIDQLYTFAELFEMTYEEIQEMGIFKVSNCADWVPIGVEGLYGWYLINLREESPEFGNIRGLINNIPRTFGFWENILDFLQSILRYCKNHPLTEYRENYETSSPTFGYIDEKCFTGD